MTDQYDKLIVATSTLHHTTPIGFGLFVCHNESFRRGELIATFNGVRRTPDGYVQRCQQGFGGYAIELRNGDVLDCYTAAQSGDCLASMANHSGENGFGARFLMKHDGIHEARSNAHIKISRSVVRLIAGRIHENFGDSGSEDDDTIVLRGGDEILWNYRVNQFLNYFNI